jgi:hypothetical protein
MVKTTAMLIDAAAFIHEASSQPIQTSAIGARAAEVAAEPASAPAQHRPRVESTKIRKVKVAKAPEKVEEKKPDPLPWESAKPGKTPFQVRLPNRLHAKLKWLDGQIPGGRSINASILMAVEEYVDAELKKLGQGGEGQ